jgi:hypothetical protein
MIREEICENLKTIITQIDETVGNRYEGVNATYIADIKPTSLRFVIEEAIKALEQEPCSDAISRQAVLELVADYDLSMGQVVKGIHALPTVTPQPKTGHWIDTDEWKETVDGFEQWGYFRKCSKCGYVFKFLEIDNYCPNCGARMESEE